MSSHCADRIRVHGEVSLQRERVCGGIDKRRGFPPGAANDGACQRTPYRAPLSRATAGRISPCHVCSLRITNLAEKIHNLLIHKPIICNGFKRFMFSAYSHAVDPFLHRSLEDSMWFRESKLVETLDLPEFIAK